MCLLSDTLKSFDENLFVLSVFVDLQKTFDTVSHSVILAKLHKLGLSNTELSWFSSYLTGRMQYVNFNGYCSDYKQLTVGVAQGSLLGVLLFQIHINDLVKSLKYSSCILYADDTTIYLIGKNLHFMKMKMQFDLNNLAIWLRSNHLKLNVSKTKVMILNKDGLFPNVDLFIEGQSLEVVCTFKCLGVHIHANLKFEMHFADVHAKLICATFVIRSLCRILLSSSLLPLYFAYYHSHLCYCLLIWFPLLSKTNQQLITILQKRIVRALSVPLFDSIVCHTLKN